MRRAGTGRAGRSAVAAAIAVLTLAAFAPSLTRGIAAQSQASGSLTREWLHWKYFRPVRVSKTSEPRLVALIVPVEVYTQAEPQLVDLRLIDDRGNEIPFAEITFPGSTRATYLPRRALEARYVPGEFTEYILELGPRPLPCDFLLLTGDAANPPALAQIDASDNDQDWRPARKRAPIGRWPAPVLTFPESSARFLRLRIFYRKTRYSIRTMIAGRQAKVPPDRAPVTGLLAPQPSTTSRTTAWRIDLRGKTPVDEADFETSQPAFSRTAAVFASADGQDWRLVREGIIFRTARDSTPTERLSVAFPPHRDRFWRVELRNGNDPPLTGVQLRLSMTPRRIVFRQQPGRAYRLLYGQSEAAAPRYDLAQTVSEQTLRAAPVLANAAGERTNMDWIDPRPWSERHTAVLWIATLVAVLILALAAVRALRRPQ